MRATSFATNAKKKLMDHKAKQSKFGAAHAGLGLGGGHQHEHKHHHAEVDLEPEPKLMLKKKFG